MMTRLALATIRWYQGAFSSGMPPACRFQPYCSHYSYAAVEKYGLVKGSFLTLRRLARCHPFHARGYDPVP